MPRARSFAVVVLTVLLGGCVTTQKVPVSTDPSGAAVYLDGQKVCAATPCSVDVSTAQSHLLTIIKDGYSLKDIQVRPTGASGNAPAIAPDIVTVRLRAPGQLDVRDPDSVVDKAVGLGMGVLKRVLEDAGKDPAPDK